METKRASGILIKLEMGQIMMFMSDGRKHVVGLLSQMQPRVTTLHSA